MRSFASLLDLTADGPGCFAAPCPAQEAPRLFGGQVAAQALRAACLSAPDGRRPHSLHAYFLRPGRPGRALRLAVTPSREGRSFSTRLVTASQDGEVILVMMASFHTGEDGPDWQAAPRPDVPGPGELHRESRQLSWFAPMAGFEIRPVPAPGPAPADGGPAPADGPVRAAALHPCWVRCTEPLPGGDAAIHACAVTFISDIGMVRAARPPNSVHRPLTGASLDHALWLHRPARADRWLLLSAGPASTSGARGLATATLHAEDGALIASVAQEAILRPSGTFRLPPAPR